MVEIKMTFGSADDAIAFLKDRAAKTTESTTVVTPPAGSTTSTTKAASDPKPTKAAAKPEASSPSAAPAETASAAAEPAPAPAPTSAPAAATTKPLEYASSDLPKRIAEMVGLGHTATVKALLAEFGAKKGPEIPADRLGEFDEKLKALETGLTASA